MYAIGNAVYDCDLLVVPHCLRAQYQPAVICAICTYCLWFTGVLRPEYYLTIHVFNPGKSPTRIPLNATVNNHPSKICIKCNCRRYYLTIRVTVIPNFSPLSNTPWLSNLFSTAYFYSHYNLLRKVHNN